MSSFFTSMGQDTITMIACILGFTTREYVYELTLAYMSIFTPSQPPEAKYYYVTFNSDKMHDQFMRLEVPAPAAEIMFSLPGFSYFGLP